MAVNLSPLFNEQILTLAGVPASGYKLFTYAAGSTTKTNTYTTSAGNVANANPIVLDSNGYPSNGAAQVQIWLTAGTSYKFVLAPSTDTDPPTSAILTEDNITGVNDTVSASVTEWTASTFTGITFVSGTQFTVTGDQTSILTLNRRLKTTNTAGTIYSYISAVDYNISNAGKTTVTVVNDSGTLDSGLSAVSYGIINPTNSSLFPAHVTQVITFDAVPLGTVLPAGVMMPYGGSSAPSGWLLCDGTSYLRTTYSALFTAISTTYGSVDGTHFNVPDLRGRLPIGSGTGVTTEAVTASSGNGFTVSSNNTKWITGIPVVLSNLTGFTTTATAGPTYYITRISSTNVRLATTLALAQAGTPDITISGTGTCTLTFTLTARTLGEVGGEEGHAQAAGELVPHTHPSHLLFGSGSVDYSTVGGSQVVASATGSTGANAAMNIMQPYATVNYIIKT